MEVTEEMIMAGLNACSLSYFQKIGTQWTRCSVDSNDVRAILTAALAVPERLTAAQIAVVDANLATAGEFLAHEDARAAVPGEPVGYLKPKFPEAVAPFYIPAAERVEDWKKLAFTIPVYGSPIAGEPVGGKVDDLAEYEPGQWWLDELKAHWGENRSSSDTRRAAKVAIDFFAKAEAALTPPADTVERMREAAPVSKLAGDVSAFLDKIEMFGRDLYNIGDERTYRNSIAPRLKELRTTLAAALQPPAPVQGGEGEL